ncbi:hypothetical protein [Companilactobacillus paralimentarius]|uniref:hypothetical protein n=1 Tax=Companilactobacillus paralimentarius TaxID=83526 RepID=UPI001D045088|nr:hypothetical protein [Companilactobacillus paralimentarius]
MSDIILKGGKDGFSVIFNENANYDDALKDLKELIMQQNVKSTNENDDVISFTIKTGKRLFTNQQRESIEEFFEKYPQLELKDIESDVEDKKKSKNYLMLIKLMLNLESYVVDKG